MTTYYVGPGGNDGNSGLTWALRFLTLNGAEDEPVVAGDVVYVGPGVYRETLTCDASGGNAYSTGTISVTKGSTTVEGSGTTWSGNVNAGYMLHVRYYDNGTDMATNGTDNVTASGGNFQSSMVGMPVQINTLGAYIISSVNASDDISITDPNGVGWPTTASELTYSVMSGEGHYEIDSVTDNDTLVLKQPWQGRTLTGLAYLTFNPITYIGDVTGEHTDGVGGVVRITGSDNDTTAARANCITATTRNYRVFRGFSVDTCSGTYLNIANSQHWVVEDMCGTGSVTTTNFAAMTSSGQFCLTFRRIMVFSCFRGFILFHTSAVDDSGHVVENVLIGGVYGSGIESQRITGFTVRNSLFINCGGRGIDVSVDGTTGQCGAVFDSILVGCATALDANTAGFLYENYNNFYANTTNRASVNTGANSTTYTPIFQPPILYAGDDQLNGYKFPWHFGDLSQWSALRTITGVDERNTDMYGIARPATAAKNSWGPVQFHDTKRETTTVHGGSGASIAFHDAGVHQMWVPVDGTEITVSVYCYRESNYAGTNPQMVIKQPGQADRTTTDVASASQWNQLSDTFTPSATPPYVVVELHSNNTASSGNYKAFFDSME